MIKINDLSFRYGRRSPPVLKGVSLSLEAGEIGIILINLSSEPFTINDGERICQMVITAHSQVVWQPVEVLDDTERGAGGFGHTGK